MEWLAGGRLPSWASPYSAQATAALLAQFPTQWPTIRDYGFAHPEIVGYMNAYAPEDAKIAYSLVEGIGTRWLVGDGTGYFKTGIIVTTNVDISVKYKHNGATNVYQQVFGSRGTNTSHTFGFYIHHVAQNGVILDIGGQRNTITIIANKNIEHTYRYYNGKFYCDNISQNVTKGNNMPTVELYLMALNIDGSESYDMCAGIAAFFDIKDTADHRFIPFKRNGQMELLDLVSGNLATRVGTFTELIETPS